MKFIFLLLPAILANLVNLGNFVLTEGELQAKSRYVFSDFNENSMLKNASVEFKIKIRFKPVLLGTRDRRPWLTKLVLF